MSTVGEAASEVRLPTRRVIIHLRSSSSGSCRAAKNGRDGWARWAMPSSASKQSTAHHGSASIPFPEMGRRTCVATGSRSQAGVSPSGLAGEDNCATSSRVEMSGLQAAKPKCLTMGMRTIKSETHVSQTPPESRRRRENMERVIRAYWYSHVTSPAGGRSGRPDESQICPALLSCNVSSCRERFKAQGQGRHRE